MAKKVYIQMRQDMSSPEGSGWPVAVYATLEEAQKAANEDSWGYVEEVDAVGLFTKADMDELANHVAQGGQY